MLIRFYNLGKIKETTLDLRPLTVIIGPNNSNKTYIAYSLYGLWQAEQYQPAAFAEAINKAFRAAKDNILTFPIDSTLWEQFRTQSDSTCKRFTDNIPFYFQDTSGKLFADTRLLLELSLDDFSATLSRLVPQTHEALGWHLEMRINQGAIEITYSPSPEGRMIGADAPDEVALNFGAQMGARFILSSAIQSLFFSQPFLLPAERNAFIITYKMLANRRYNALREGYRQAFGGGGAISQRQLDLLREGGEVRYPQPVEDFLDFLTAVESAKPPNTRSPFAKLADTIESSIQNTNKTRYRSTALGGKEIITQIEKGLDIDLYNASSSIKQLAPLLLYLRYRAKENDLLIIDEPEMNLHPESQAKLLEVLAMLVNHGVNVLLTTHSPYLMAHLNNLAQADGTSQAVRNRQAKSLYLKHPDSLLRMDQVSAYEMKDNQLQSLKDPDYGIRWDTLSDVSADLQQRYFAIYEEGHAKERTGNGRKAAIPKGGQSASGQTRPDQP